MEEAKYHTVKEVATKFRVSRQAVYDWITSGRLGAIKVGDRVRIPESALGLFVQTIQPGERVVDPEDASRGNTAPIALYA